jgi:nucleoside-diphosphate-sugar epimerase
LKAAEGTLADESSSLDVNASPGVAASARTYTELEARLFSSNPIATVALLAAEPGVYNLVDDDPSPQTVWLPAFAKFLGAPVPPHLSEAEVTAVAGEDAVYDTTKLSGASNAKAKRVLGWKPRRLEWLA